MKSDKSISKKKKSPFLIVLICILSAIFLYSAVNLGIIAYRYLHNDHVQKEVQSMFYPDGIPAEPESSSNDASSETQRSSGSIRSTLDRWIDRIFGDNNGKENTVIHSESASGDPQDDPAAADSSAAQPAADYSFDSLLSLNPDVVGWLSFPGCGIETVVCQTNNNTYYLDHNVYGGFEYAGTCFLDCSTWPGATDIAILYGHSMLNGSMLYPTRSYLDQGFASSNPYFWYYTPDCVYRCDLISVFVTTDSDPYLTFNYGSEESLFNYIENMRSRSEVVFPEMTLQSGDRFLLISTCNYDRTGHSGRMPLLARLTPVG